MKMHRSTIICILIWTLLAIEFCSAYYYTEPQQQYGNGAYQFSYQTGTHNEPDLAQSFREESRDEYGNVHGKYGYVDPYGQLRIVKYRAGSDGYYAEGDVGVDQEALRQQRLLYGNDPATRTQQTWQQAGQGSSSSSAASAAASASSSAAGGGYYGGTKPDWTTVTDNSINQQYNIKGGNSKSRNIYSERIVAAPIPSPVKTLNYLSNQYNQRQVLTNNQYQLPVVRQYTHTTVHQVPGAIQPTPFIPTAAARYYQTKSYNQQQYSGALKSPAARYTEIQHEQQQPTIITPFKSLTSAYKSASSSGSSASASSSSSSAAYTDGSPIKGGYRQQQPQQQRSSRYSIPGTGQARAQVNFKQYGPAAFQYSYAF
ncbi:uncharacterized protein LOC124500564 [Dermatophagoides farinae]|uniref:uncharacterized protein LOC124500564 n=1 Tax=Dermatophagoides farinae TaxID=6954 RepID=UPI003F631CBD